jgi:fibronectin-binding autotransporter adhesin
MKNTKCSFRSKIIALSMGIAVAGLSPFGLPSLHAANDAWSTSPASGDFSGALGADWTTGTTTPGAANGTAASGDSLYFGTSTITTATNDQTGYSFAGLTFNSGANAFTIGGNVFTLTGAITNSGTNVQTLNTPITLGAPENISAASGNIVLGGAIGDNTNGYGITLTGANTVTLSASNTYSGATTVNNGTLAFSGAGSSSSSAITVGQTTGAVAVAALTVTPTTSGTTTLGSSLTWNGESVTTSGVNNVSNFTVNGVAAGNTVENFGALTLNPGLVEGNIVPNASANVQVVFSSVTRNPGSIFYFGRSDNNSAQVVGASTIASQTAGKDNIIFTTAPTLSGDMAARLARPM